MTALSLVKERPILFSSEMVRAILAGNKTQTRRGVAARLMLPEDLGGIRLESCPYGKVGDRLWVKETFQWNEEHDGGFEPMFSRTTPRFYYAADYVHPDSLSPWKSSIFMPRQASRILLEVVSVRVERLKDMDGLDAWAEGVACSAWAESDWDDGGYPTSWENRYAYAREQFEELWDSINGKSPGKTWTDNPYVWVIEFKRVHP